MNTVAFVGAGHLGSTIARLAVAAGLSVVLSNSRGPQSLVDLVNDLGDSATAATVDEAAAASDYVVLAIPYGAYQSIPVDPFEGKVVIDSNNYFPDRDGTFDELLTGKVTSTELIQRHLAGARIAKAFNTIYAPHLSNLARPADAPDRSALAVASDDETAKTMTIGLLNVLGWDAVDGGTLADSWRLQPGSPAFVCPYMTLEDFSTLPNDPGKPTSAAAIRRALDAAAR